jgi:Ca2+-binding RTX toxin-like protein
MGIIGGIDERRVIRPSDPNFTVFPLPAVTAIDTTFPNTPGQSPNGYGSGIVIAPNHVLTAAHVVYDYGLKSNAKKIRVTTSANATETNLIDRIIGNPLDPGPNVNDIYYPFFPLYNNRKYDIALLETDNVLLPSDEVVGLIAFVDPVDNEDAIKYNTPIQTAGYPGDNIPGLTTVNGIPNNTGLQLRDLALAPGNFDLGNITSVYYDRRINYTSNIDTYQGQSGSGIWHTLEGDTKPRVLGIHNSDIGVGGITSYNSGILFDTELYYKIINQTEDAAYNGNSLPENAIIGSDPSFFSAINPFSSAGNDIIYGTYRRERILGNKGNDKLFGGGANDRLEGGEGVDQALFSDSFTDSNNYFNYEWTITNPGNIENPEFKFEHDLGLGIDGIDTTKDIEFGVFEFVDENGDFVDDDGELFYVPLQVDPNNPTKLKDGPEITPETDLLDGDGNKLGEMTVTSPAWMFDGDVEYKLNIGSEQGALYNFAYIIDKSGSMRGGNLAAAKSAYNSLTQFLIDEGIAQQSEFGVVQFNSSARLIGPTNATLALAQINLLYAEGGTNFAPALAEAQSFFESRNNNATNIAYFLSDGIGSGASSSLQSVAEVRAFGIGNADLSALNIIDSDNAVLLSNPSDLITEFASSPIDSSTIERIDVKLAGTVVDTISPDSLVEGTLGLEYQGSIEGLEVSREAENEITFELVFNNGTPNATLDYTITTGQEEVRQQTNDGNTEVITFSVNQADFTDSSGASFTSFNSTNLFGSPSNTSFALASASLAAPIASTVVEREIIGNDLDNTIQIQQGQNTIFGNAGNDRFILDGGVNLVDGGAGIDTLEIRLTKSEAGEVSKSGDVINIGTDTTALNIEYIEFADVLLEVETLLAAPVISFAERAVTVREGDTDSTFANFTVNLSSVATEEVVIEVSARSDDAVSGIDFLQPSEQFIIAPGETTGDIAFEIVGDTDIEGDEEVFLDFKVASGAIFDLGATSEIAGVNIIDDDSEISVSTTESNLAVFEGNSDRPSTLDITLNRFGSSIDSDTIKVELVPVGDNPAEAADLVNGLTPIEITFAPGEDTKIVKLAIAPDSTVEADETFKIELTSVSGSALVTNQNTVFTIFNDDLGNSIVGSAGKDKLYGTQKVDIIEGLEGKDKLYGGLDNDKLYGGLGNDKLYGGSGNDTLIGASIGESQPGMDEKDVLQGDSGADLFVLGDRNNIFYVGNNKHDYAEIKDWSSEEGDMIQLSSQGNYSLGSSGSKYSSHKKISIFDDGDLIAVIKNKGSEHLDLNNSDQFSFV